MQQTRDRCWLTHKRREPWMICPLCNQPIAWRRTDVDGWVPCDELPVLFVPGGRLRLVVRRDLLDGCKLYRPGKDKDRPLYAMLPHFYTCPVLKQERADWAFRKRLEGGFYGAHGARTAK